MNLAQILMAMIDRPARAMREAAQRPRSWLLPAAFLVISMVFLAWMSAPYQLELTNERSAQMIERIAANMPEEQARIVRESASEMTMNRYLMTSAGVGLIVAGLAWVVRGALVHFSSMALGGISTWAPTFAIGVWSMLPFFVRDLVQAIYVWLKGQVLEHQGLGFLVASGDWLKDSQSVQYALLANIDPFALWHLVLLATGIAVATKVSRTKATVLALVVWAVFLGLKIVPVAVTSAISPGLTG